MSNWQLTAYSIVAALAVILSRVGIARRVGDIERKVESLKDDFKTSQTMMRNRMEQSRMEFRSEVDNALAPVNRKLDSMDSTLGELTTMVSSIVNRVSDEPIISKQPDTRS